MIPHTVYGWVFAFIALAISLSLLVIFICIIAQLVEDRDLKRKAREHAQGPTRSDPWASLPPKWRPEAKYVEPKTRGRLP